ncbi:hypothetical protein SAMN06272735_5496 [Streptomyces sp. TLI_55]|uniref:hypothetical protein n=1 Tax=Streptomyces sp. TLI_55 TaxID=1938861 RepID=UPI000BD35ADB|nr:hypothetical protein [Streptomyces sp. TLI_55]SNX63685.1 hypothetical protein SAMN06272735_5496 [Streptomyces sp. TLI_55]
MSRPPQYENGIGAAGAPQAAPNVYHPQPGPAPSYDAYADPALAHGWENAYDETAELPPMTLPAPAPLELPAAPGGGAGPRSRRKPKTGPWRSRRVAVAAGAVGAVSVAALIAGFSLSGSSDGPEDKGAPTGSAAPDVSTEPALSAPGETGSPVSGSAPVSAAPSAQPSAAKSDKTAVPAPGASATTTAPAPVPTPTATQSDPGPDSGAGSGGKPGKGRGNTKRPR